MKAAVLKQFGQPLVVEDVAEPILGTGEVIVDVVATPMLPYSNEVLSGERNYPLPPPVIPGCGAVGRVRAIGPDATKLKAGDWVFCNPTVRSRDEVRMPDIVLQGWSSRGPGGAKLQTYHLHGTFAEQVRIPTENAARIGDIDPAEAAQWCALNTLLIPYGGLLAADLKAGETVLVSGATGHFGSATVAVALAMGAMRVVAPGRSKTALADLERLFGDRVRTVVLTGEEETDRERMMAAAGGPIDCVIDFMPPSVSTKVVRTAVMTVRPYGRVVLMGGVGMLGGEDLALPYPWIMRNDIKMIGKWMYAPDIVPLMVGLVRAGLLRLDDWETTEFPLGAINDAVTHAAETRGPLRLTVVRS